MDILLGAVSQTIAFGPLSNVVIGSGSVTLTATASSGLAVSFASETPGICTVSGASVNLVAVGLCSIAAGQGGSSIYAVATGVTQTFRYFACCADGDCGGAECGAGVSAGRRL